MMSVKQTCMIECLLYTRQIRPFLIHFQITELLCTLDFGYKMLKAYDIRDQHFIENLKIT